MAPSPQTQGRPRLGTVLSRKQWEDRRSDSTTSSTHSHASIGENTGRSFDPDNEALVSTEPINPFPAMKDSRKGLDETAWQIDMQAAKEAFSQGSDSGSDAFDLSIEVGRGARPGHRAVEDSRNDDSINSSNAMIGDYRVMYSPPLSTRRQSTKPINNDPVRNLRQDAQIRLASMASQKENRDPVTQAFKSTKPSDIPSRVKRKTLGEIHARASEGYDGSLLNDDRPTQVAPSTKTTRFSHSKRNSSNQVSVNGTNTGTGIAQINQSYILPDLPNLSQIVSGTIQDRTPGRMRLAAHPALSHTPRGPMHKPIDVVPIPDDEKAIFVSLNLLQGKVNELEAASSEFQKTIEELKTKNLILKAEKKDLRVENDKLSKENDELRSKSTVYPSAIQPEQQTQRQPSPQKQRRANVLAQVNSQVLKILQDRQEEDLFSLAPTESVKLRPASAPPQESRVTVQTNSHRPGPNAEQVVATSNARPSKKVVIDEAVKKSGHDKGRNIGREPMHTQDMTYLSTQSGPQYLLDLRKMLEAERVDTKKRNRSTATHEATNTATNHAVETKTAPSIAHQALPRKSSMKDVSERVAASDIAAATLANVRAQGANMAQVTCDQDISEDITEQVPHPISHVLRRNSDPTATAASNTSRRRRHATDFEDENMTSAFIIPDITIAQPTVTAAAPTATAPATGAHLTDAAQHLIHSINPHDATNCIVCSRLTSPTSTNPVSKKSILIPKPLPVSSTPVAPTPDNPDPTLRPAQPPALALAIVLKELHDQHEHLKARLARAQARYQQTDPRMSRTKRVRLGREIEGLTRQCEGLADMIYRLYDVLEGQRGNGVGDMNEEEVEVTVQELREVVGRMAGRGREGSGSEGEDGDGDGDGEESE